MNMTGLWVIGLVGAEIASQQCAPTQLQPAQTLRRANKKVSSEDLDAGFWRWRGVLVMPGERPVIARLLGTVFYPGAMTAFFGEVTSRARRGAGGVDELSRMQAAVKAGAVPPDVDSSTWIPMLEKWNDQNRRSRWLAPVVFTGFLTLSFWLASTSGPGWFVLALVLLALLIVSTVSAWRGHGKLTRMLDELRGREPHAR